MIDRIGINRRFCALKPGRDTEENSSITVRLPLAALVAIVLVPACRTLAEPPPPLVQPGAPGAASRVISATEAVDVSRIRPTVADVRFMQGMIGHHAQALEMTSLLPSRTTREDMRLLARRIELSQADEIAVMQRWLRARGEMVPDPHAHHSHGNALMPGMLTPEEMRRLETTSGAEFDRLFLEFMIKHHDGALVMVNQLLSTNSAAQEPELFEFVSDVDADQRIEIDRMSAMLLEILK